MELNNLPTGANVTVSPAATPQSQPVVSLKTKNGEILIKHFQPSNVNYGLFPPLAGRVQKRLRNEAYAERAGAAFSEWLGGLPERLLPPRS